MDELRDAMHAAASMPPATSIDLDQLIAGERRRARWRYRAGAAGGAAVLVAGGLLVPTLVSSHSGGLGAAGPGHGGPSGCRYSPGAGTPWPTLVPNPLVPEASRQPSAPGDDTFPPVDCTGSTGRCPALPRTSSPQPSQPGGRPGRVQEDCAQAVVRLSSALAVAMGDALPGWGVTASVDPGNPSVQWVFLRQAEDASPDVYVASLDLAKGSQFSRLQVMVAVGDGTGASGGCAKQHLEPGAACEVLPGGDVLVTRPALDVGGGSAMDGGYRVTDIHTDGTMVEVLGSKPLTADQLKTIARSTGLTLYP